ncbi:unnamed protein product [Caenorhabditis brenneri]
MLLSVLIPVLSALLGVVSQVVNVRLPTFYGRQTEVGDDFFFSFNFCEVHKHAPSCFLRQLVCQKNFLYPVPKTTVLFRIGYKKDYMGETISDTHDIPFNLTKKYNSFVFRLNKGSDLLFYPTEKVCRTSEGDYTNSSCHWLCDFREWNVNTNKEVRWNPEVTWAMVNGGDRNCTMAEFGTVWNTCRACTPSKKCKNGRCLVQNGVVHENTCSCEHGYYGANCDRDSACILANPCHKGTCRRSPESPSGVRCECQPGFYGEHCDLSHDKPKFCRKNSDCQNGGKCITRRNKSNYCKCPNDFVGNFCEVPFQCPNNRS